MSKPSYPQKAVLSAGIMFSDQSFFKKSVDELKKSFGNLLFISRSFDFCYTDYYAKEMGASLLKRFVFFKKFVEQDKLPDIKHIAWDIEEKLSIDNKRRVNIDPGLLTMEKFILSTGKNYSHRIYMGKGVFADLNLVFKNDDFQEFEWTYPDYRQDETKRILLIVRKYLKEYK